MREHKSTGFMAIKDVDGRDVIGIASVFGNIDSYNDIVHPRSFRKTIKENGHRVKHLWQHDFWAPPVANITKLAEVKRDALPEKIQEEFPEAKGGLEVHRSYLNTDRGDEILEGITSGAITEMSFGFDPVKFDFNEVELDEDRTIMVRHIRELRLWDTSDVNWGANPATSASKSEEGFLFTKGFTDEDGYRLRFLLTKFTAAVKEQGITPEFAADLSSEFSDLVKLLEGLSPEPAKATPLTPQGLMLRLRLMEHDQI